MFDFATIVLAIAEKSFNLLLNTHFLRIHIYHQITKAYDTREVHIIKTTILNINENLTILLSKWQRTSHYPFIKMSTNISLSGYQNVQEHPLSVYHNVNEHLTIRISKSSRTYHYHYDVVLTNKWDLINISLMSLLTDFLSHLRHDI